MEEIMSGLRTITRRLLRALPLLAALLASAAVSADGEPPGEGNTFAVRDVRLFDGTQTVERTTVVVRNGLIDAVGPNLPIPDGIPVIDGAGKTLLPGFIDAHAHSDIESAMADELRFGVTTELDMSNSARFAASQRSRRCASA